MYYHPPFAHDQPVGFEGATAILVSKIERELGRVYKLQRGGERSYGAAGKRTILRTIPTSLSCLDTIPR